MTLKCARSHQVWGLGLVVPEIPVRRGIDLAPDKCGGQVEIKNTTKPDRRNPALKALNKYTSMYLNYLHGGWLDVYVLFARPSIIMFDATAHYPELVPRLPC